MSSTVTLNIRGSGAGAFSSSSADTLLLRLLVGGSVPCLDGEGCAVGNKTRFEPLHEVGIILKDIGGGVIGSDGEAVWAGKAIAQLEGIDSPFSEVIGNAVDVFEFIRHDLPHGGKENDFKFKGPSPINLKPVGGPKAFQ
jgi:hypothetical protein